MYFKRLSVTTGEEKGIGRSLFVKDDSKWSVLQIGHDVQLLHTKGHYILLATTDTQNKKR